MDTKSELLRYAMSDFHRVSRTRRCERSFSGSLPWSFFRGPFFRGSFFRVLSVLLSTYLLFGLVPAPVSAETGDPEVGIVQWKRDFDAALLESKKTRKPLFVLFQEVPGCHGCKKFGQTVLVDPLIVEAIETLFIPVLVYNNRGGKDAELLKRYREPSWNFQVVRFLDASGKDILPRKDKVWTKKGIVLRMIKALEQSERTVPSYLRGMQAEYTSKLETLAIAMYCYWTGERVLGALPGVVKTEAGWIDGREVTRVWYDADLIQPETIVERAMHARSADTLFVHNDVLLAAKKGGKQIYGFPLSKAGVLRESRYSVAKASDQKRQLLGTAFQSLTLSPYQSTKVNAFVRENIDRARGFLSPRQRTMLDRSIR